MKAIIINNEIKFDEDSLSLADMGYEIGEEVEVFEFGDEVEVFEFDGFYMMTAKSDIYVGDTLAIFEGEEFGVSDEEIEVVA